MDGKWPRPAHVARPAISAVVSQHAEDAAALRHTRSVLVRAPHVRLHRLRRVDDRLAAHLDGLAVAGPDGWKLAQSALESPGPGPVFAATVLAIEDRNTAALDKLLALAEAHRPARTGLVSAFGWVSAGSLRGTASGMLFSGDPFQRQVGLATFVMRGLDPGKALDQALTVDHAELRTRALWAAGSLGRLDCLASCVEALGDEDPVMRFHAARSAWLIGDRGEPSSGVIESFALATGPGQRQALVLLLKVGIAAQAHALLKVLAAEENQRRTLLRGVGIAGDPHYVPWLIDQMSDLALTRLAGESFSLITGLDLAYLDLERKPPEGEIFGPNHDPDDANVAMDEDDGLPWPDPDKIIRWWRANGARFRPGTRYFVGKPPSIPHCISVLKTGFQRQRIAAAEYLCLLNPGTPLFNVAAPAWRQERLLAQMTD